MEIYEFDVVIIGGGLVGCSCVLYIFCVDLKIVILDKNLVVGVLVIIYKIVNYLGVVGNISGNVLLDEMWE